MHGQVCDAIQMNEHRKMPLEFWLCEWTDKAHHEDSLDKGLSPSNPSQENEKSEIQNIRYYQRKIDAQKVSFDEFPEQEEFDLGQKLTKELKEGKTQFVKLANLDHF